MSFCSSLGSSRIVHKNNQSETPTPTSSNKSVRIPVNESIEYVAVSSYGFEDESQKRRLSDNNYKAKKHCAGIYITDLFRDQR